MDVDLLSYFLDRMTRAYDEQMWSVALVGAMAGFLVTQADRLVGLIGRPLLLVGIWATGLLGLIFIWSRHFIFLHYDTLARTMIDISTPGALCTPDRVPQAAKFLAGWSGVSLYSVIVLGMTLVAAKVIASSGKTVS